MNIRFLRYGAVLALLAVLSGAFGAHGLEKIVTPAELETFEVAVRYQFYHAFALLIAGMLGPHRLLTLAGWSFTAGILLFSGSLYLLAIDDALGLTLRWLGPVTPLGGVLFILGWAALVLSTFKQVNNTVENMAKRPG